MYSDVHTHLTHKKFADDWEIVLKRAIDRGVNRVVVNGLEPVSNRQILAMASQYSEVIPATGIYPIDAVNDLLPDDFQIKVQPFDVDEEVAWIREQAANGTIKAVGECGLDGYWLDPSTFPRQEEVFRSLVQVAMDHDIPVIIHTRKLERRAIEILTEMQTKRVNFHCFGGKTKLAQKAAEDHHWHFSIPANARVNEAFGKMLRNLPIDCILTETDAPYLAPERGTRNEPANVVQTVEYFAQLRGISIGQAADQIRQNFDRLFS